MKILITLIVLTAFWIEGFATHQELVGEISYISIEEYTNIVGNVNPNNLRIPTLNNNGSSFCFTTDLTDAFLDDCSQKYDYVLEVGCAFGIKTSQIVQTNTHVIANDLDSRHIAIMKNAFKICAVENPYFHKAEFSIGNIANKSLNDLGGREFDAILVESVMHFMTPEQVRATLENFYQYLKPGGRVYLTIFTPFVTSFYEAYLKNKAQNEEWPGYFEDPEKLSPAYARCHKPYHVFDQETLVRELKRAKFHVLTTKYISKPFIEPERYIDGREWLVAIAEKRE